MTREINARVFCRSLQLTSPACCATILRSQIGDDGALALGLCLEHNRSLRTLGLAFNRITAQGAASIASALCSNEDEARMGNATLKRLDMDHNALGAVGIVAIAASLEHNATLEKYEADFHRALAFVDISLRKIVKGYLFVHVVISQPSRVCKSRPVTHIHPFLHTHSNAPAHPVCTWSRARPATRAPPRWRCSCACRRARCANCTSMRMRSAAAAAAAMEKTTTRRRMVWRRSPLRCAKTRRSR